MKKYRKPEIEEEIVEIEDICGSSDGVVEEQGYEGPINDDPLGFGKK